MNDPTPTLRMFAEYDCYPLWVTLPGAVEGRSTVTYRDHRRPAAVTVTG